MNNFLHLRTGIKFRSNLSSNSMFYLRLFPQIYGYKNEKYVYIKKNSSLRLVVLKLC